MEANNYQLSVMLKACGSSNEQRALGQYCSNWMNVLIVLPSPVQVRRGDVICVQTTTDVSSAVPRYTFEVQVKKKRRPDITLMR